MAGEVTNITEGLKFYVHIIVAYNNSLAIHMHGERSECSPGFNEAHVVNDTVYEAIPDVHLIIIAYIRDCVDRIRAHIPSAHIDVAI